MILRLEKLLYLLVLKWVVLVQLQVTLLGCEHFSLTDEFQRDISHSDHAKNWGEKGKKLLL